MRDQLRHRPIHRRHRAAAQAVRRIAILAHFRGRQMHFHGHAERAMRLVVIVAQIIERGGIAGWAGVLRGAERRERVHRHDPRADGRVEALGEERTERLVFPGLQIARGPIVEDADPGDVPVRIGDVDRIAELIALADPDRHFELVIEPLRRTDRGRIGIGRLGLPLGPGHFAARYAHRAGAAVIADRHVFVVRQQRIVGAEQLADIGGVIDAGVEIGVIANVERQMEFAVARAIEQRFDRRLLAAIGQQFEQRVAQGRHALRAASEQGVEIGATAQFADLARIVGHVVGRHFEIEDHVPDRDAHTLLRSAARKDREGQILDRKIGMVFAAEDPGTGVGGMGVIGRVVRSWGHGSSALGKPVQQSS